MTEAKYWTKLDDGRVECGLCPQRCRIPDTGHGICLGRVNRGGTLYADNYGQCVTVSMDPVEKKIGLSVILLQSSVEIKDVLLPVLQGDAIPLPEIEDGTPRIVNTLSDLVKKFNIKDAL